MRCFLLYTFFLLSALFIQTVPSHAGTLMNGQTIICGYKDGKTHGEKVECNLETQQCVVCTQRKKGTGVLTYATLGSYARKVQVYKCLPGNARIPANCELAMNGGLKGDMWSRHLYLFKTSRVEGDNCIAQNFVVKYSTCYGCTVVQTLTSAFVKAAGKAYDVSKEAGNVLVLLLMMFWLAFFAFRNVSSFATVEPMQILQQFFVQCFKVILVLVLLNRGGIQTILNYTLVPIVTAGTDIADSITANLQMERLGLSESDIGESDE